MIFEKLQKARVMLQDKQLKKSGKNKFAGFTYYELADILPSINVIFRDLKLCSNFSLDHDIASLKITDWEDGSTEIFTSPVEDLELKGCCKIQALGGVHTYLKRYLYLNALEIVEADMLDAQAGNMEVFQEKPKPTTKKTTKEPTTDEIILAGLAKMQTSAEASAYYKDNENNVTDLEAFKAAYSKRWMALRAKEKKVDNE
jgi:hypothetical protein